MKGIYKSGKWHVASGNIERVNDRWFTDTISSKLERERAGGIGYAPNDVSPAVAAEDRRRFRDENRARAEI